jgi:hypothetical protein
MCQKGPGTLKKVGFTEEKEKKIGRGNAIPQNM